MVDFLGALCRNTPQETVLLRCEDTANRVFERVAGSIVGQVVRRFVEIVEFCEKLALRASFLCERVVTEVMNVGIYTENYTTRAVFHAKNALNVNLVEVEEEEIVPCTGLVQKGRPLLRDYHDTI